MSRTIWLLLFSFALGCSWIGQAELRAEEGASGAKKEAAAKEDKESEKSDEEKEEAKEKEPDLYEVPTTTDCDELLQFIYRLRDFQPKNAAEALKHRRKASEAAFLAAGHIVSFSKDKSSEAYRFAYPLVAMRDLAALYTKSAEEQVKAYEDVRSFINEGKELGVNEVRLMQMVTRALEMSENEELAEKAYTEFAEKLSASEDPQLQRRGRMFAGSVRRMKLVGNSMELTGVQMDGTKFDLKSLQGKTVLVDFWATWCGPCLATIPQVREMYEAYQSKGFEVVGISLDEDREELESFLKKQQLPWIILHQEGGWEHPAALDYGVTGIPSMFLVGPDGKVLSTQARGPELVRLLEEQYGPIPEKKDEDKEEKKEEAKDNESDAAKSDK